VVLTALMLGVWARGCAAEVLDLRTQRDLVDLAPYAEVYEDRSGAQSSADIVRAPFVPASAPLILGNPGSAFWIRLRYIGGVEEPWILTAGYRPEQADLLDGDRAVHSGDVVPVADRETAYFNWIAFDLPPAPHPRTVYLRLRTYEPLVNLVAYPREAFRANVTRDIIVIAALLGVLGSLALSSLVLYFVMRDSLYLYYAGYILCQFVYRANDFGLISTWLFPHASFPYVRSEVVFDGVTLVAATLFIRRFLRSHAHSRVLDRINTVIAAVGAAYALLALAGVPIRYTLVQNFSFVYVPVWIATGVACWRKGYRPARLFLFAWTAFMIGIVIEAAVDLGLGARLGIVRESGLDVALDYLVYLGIALESILLSLSLAQAYQTANEEKIAHLSELIAMRERTERMAHLAYSDGLTNLPNRTAFVERVDESLRAASRHGRRSALLYIDVDQFKQINDTLGHQAGDQALIEAAARLRKTVRGDEMVGRLAGDEFAVFLPSIEADDEPRHVRERIAAAFHEPFDISGNLLPIAVSVGIATFPDQAATREELFAAADAAMYERKAAQSR
jgi:diguanylate cyclase (GGDEF)-like protein